MSAGDPVALVRALLASASDLLAGGALCDPGALAGPLAHQTLALVLESPDRYAVVQAARTPDEVHADLWQTILERVTR